MDEEYEFYRNDYWDEAEDRRNRRRPPPQQPRAVVPWGRPAYAAPVYPTPPAYPPAPPVVVAPARRGLRDMPTGVLAEAATLALVALQPLPAPPGPVGEMGTDLANLVAYQTALATYNKRNDQIRTLGALARLFI